MPEGSRPAKTASVQEPILPVTGVITPAFKLVFLSIIGLTVLSLMVSLGLAIWADLKNESIKNLLETCSTTWKMGFGAIIGFIGGKAL